MPSLLSKWLYLGDRPPWEQLVGEVSGLVRLLGCREGVRPMVLLGEPCVKAEESSVTQEINTEHSPTLPRPRNPRVYERADFA